MRHVTMLRWLGLAVLLLVAGSARANQIVVLAGGCGTGSPVSGQEIVYVDTLGNQCGASGGGGPTPAGTNVIGYVSSDPCMQLIKVSVPISQAGSAKVVSGTSAKKTYICSLMVVGADAESVSLVEGTGSTCGTNTAAVIGATTAANGPNLAANGGFQAGSGIGTVAAGATAATDTCLFQSGSGRVAGVLTYVQQ